MPGAFPRSGFVIYSKKHESNAQKNAMERHFYILLLR